MSYPFADGRDACGPFTYIVPIIGSLLYVIFVLDTIKKQYWGLTAALTVWFTFVLVLSTQDVLFDNPETWVYPDDWPGFIGLALLPSFPPTIAIYFYFKNDHFRQYILGIPAWVMIMSQVYRSGGYVYLYLWYQGAMPNYVGFQTGVLDIFMGLTSLPVGYLVKTSGLTKNKRLVIIWHCLGLYDLASGISLCTLSFATLYNTQGFPLFGFFPISSIVGWQVPIAISIHLLFLFQYDVLLEHEGKKTPPLSPEVAIATSSA